MNKKILFIISEIEIKYFEFNPLVTDFWLIKEFLERDCEVSICSPSALFIKKGVPCAKVFATKVQNDDIIYDKIASEINLNDFDVVFLRPDPPVDIDYINTCYVLNYVDKTKTLILNSSNAILEKNEKLYVNEFDNIAPDNIEKKTGVLLEYRTIAEDGVKSGKHRFYPGQILYSKIRPNLSKVVVVDFDGLCSADMYPIEALGDTKCLWYFMLSENFLEQASSAGSRSVLPKINQKELSALTVTIPESIEEQKEVSKIIDSLFAKEYQVKESAEAVIEQIDTMKKAILARAFRGELGTNDPSEESAVELLKRVLEAK